MIAPTTSPKSPIRAATFYGYAYDSLNRLVQTTDQVSATVGLTRDSLDNVTAYADPRSITTSYVRNGFGMSSRKYRQTPALRPL